MPSNEKCKPTLKLVTSSRSGTIEIVVLRQREEADADLHARAKQAQAQYLERKAEADDLKELAGAYSELAHVLGGPQGLV